MRKRLFSYLVIGCVFLGMFFWVFDFRGRASGERYDFHFSSLTMSVPKGYFFGDYLKYGGWGFAVGDGDTISIIATTDGLQPYNESTKDTFDVYRREGGGVISLLIYDRLRRAQKENHIYKGEFLDSAGLKPTEEYGLDKYIVSDGANILYLGRSKKAWVRYSCYPEDGGYCNGVSCSADLCLRYRTNISSLRSWEDVNSSLWTLVESFVVEAD